MSQTIKKTRSTYTTEQGSEGTCYAHATTRVIARFIKIFLNIQYENYPDEDEIGKLYDTDKCRNIFICLDEFKETHSITDLQIIPILLFRCIYNIIVKKFGINGGREYRTIQYFFSKIKRVNKDKLISILDAQDHVDYYENIESIYHIINALRDITIPQFRYDMLNSKNQFKVISKLITSLDAGYYSLIAIVRTGSPHNIKFFGGHTMVISGYEIVDGAVKLKIKNSWGLHGYKINYDYFDVENGEITISVDRLLRYNGLVEIRCFDTQETIEYPAVPWDELITQLPETFNLTPINSIKDDKVDDDFLFSVRCIIFFILVKAGENMDSTRLSSLDKIRLEIDMTCSQERNNLSICQVLEYLNRLVKSSGHTPVTIRYDPTDKPTIEIFREFFKKYPVQMPLIVEKLCDKLIEPNKGIKLSLLFSNDPDRLKRSVRDNRYRIKRWHTPFFTSKGKKKQRLKTKRIY